MSSPQSVTTVLGCAARSNSGGTGLSGAGQGRGAAELEPEYRPLSDFGCKNAPAPVK
jgi:hypothetical protein